MPASLEAARRIVRRGLVLSAVGMAGLAGVYLLALRFTPVEARQGLAQKIFYLHVPAAWNALLAFSLVGLASILYLWLHDPRLDRFAAASANAGVAFSAVMLTTGPIWAKPIWGTWWTWDARLTLTLFLFFLIRGLPGATGSGARPGRAGPLQRGGRHPGDAAGALHPPERVPLPHPSPAADRAQSRALRRCRWKCSVPC